MSEWAISTLGKIANITKLAGFEFTKYIHYEPDGEIIALRALNLKDGTLNLESVKHISRSSSDSLPRSKLYKDDIVFSYTGIKLGEAALVDRDDTYHLAPNICRLRVNSSADVQFVYYYLRSPAFRELLRGYVVGSTQPTIPMVNIRQIKIPLPPLPEQRRIAEILGALDEKIGLNHRMNRTLESMAQRVFRKWFVENIDVDTWEVKTLDDVLAVLETGSRPKGGVTQEPIGIPSVGAESIVKIGYFDFSKTKYVSNEFFESMRRGHVEDRDVLLYKDGGRPGEFEPHVSMFGSGFPFEKFSINEHVYRLRIAPPFSQVYFYFWLESDEIMEEMRSRGTGVAIPGLNSTALSGISISIPPEKLLNDFTNYAEPLISKIFANAKESRTLASLRDSLLPKLLRGEVRVK